jgi:hypothetical protein
MRQWLNFEWNRSMKKSEGYINNPFTKAQMELVTPKGKSVELVTICYNTATFVNSLMLNLFGKVPYQENGCDCGVFVCRYAYNLYIMRDQVFSYFGLKKSFKDLVTTGPAFQFGMREIARVRVEMKALIKSITVLYSEFKKEEKARKAEAKRRANEASKATAQDTKWQDEDGQ